MIKSYTNADLSTKGINESDYLFYQVWKELTDSKTFDTYQFKSFNVIDGIKEAIHNVSNYLNHLVNTTHSIDSVIEELMKEIRYDSVLIDKFPHHKNRLLDLLGKKRSTYANYKALLYKLNFYLNEFAEKYDVFTIECLCESITNQQENKTIQLTSVFVSRRINDGWSAKALNRKLDSNTDDIETFLHKILNSSKQNYAIMFPLRSKITFQAGKTKEENRELLIEQLRRFGIDALSKEAILSGYPDLDSSLIVDEYYMIAFAESYDIYSASHSAIIKMSNTLNVFSFFAVIDSWNISDKIWIAYNIDSPYSKKLSPNEIYGTYEYLDSSSNVYSRTERIINSSDYNGDLVQKLFSSFSYSSLSQLSVSVEEKYINMWIALESLTRTDSSDNIIGNILISIPASASTRYIYKEMRNFIEDCFRCGISLEFGTMNIKKNDANKENMVKNMLLIFQDTTQYTILEQRCEVSSLLKYRCNELHTIFDNETKLYERIKSHCQTIKWHLDRLYRIRNEIAHSANRQHISTIRYAEHLYDYLATYISELVRFASNKQLVGYDELAVAIVDNYNEFLDIVGDKSIKDKKSILSKLWSTGIIDLV